MYSIAKSYTAVAVLRSFDIDGQLGELVPDLPESLRSLTVRALLSHTSGLNDYFGWTDYRVAVEAREDAWEIDRVLAGAVVDHAGRFRYSNIGFALLRLALEHNDSADFFTIISRRVLQPLGVEAFPFASRGDWLACTHESIGEELRAYDPGWVFTGTFAAEPDEAARGIAAVMRGKLGDDIPRLMMQSVPVGAPAWHPLSPQAGYGLGVMSKGKPVTLVGHGGQGPGFNLFAAVSADGLRWSGRVAEGQGEDLDLIRSCVNDVENRDGGVASSGLTYDPDLSGR
ncbi:serine hydrolase domain-containing protein [Stackebrandtia endophytica]|uniref:serine hydrolase domain-containing protein n=1 Tax=Stackebrandtia endophytica TaxID=1496996 RepID=UPI0014771A25|nr:serine hydrolase domain-containing protein [Stackebrandtia endophytica]